ncbi:VOC family protein [Ideonella sp. DXS29W]|uniref:VOC family protein n=1 Tax=Ideonella lacteola TaxID=2984193 RepID=A0ABU9BIN3_9BURK
MGHRIVWVDIPVTDLDRAIAFYSAVLGSQVTKEGGPGFSFGLLPHTGDEVGGCLYLGGADNAPSATGPLIYLNAEGRLAQAVDAVTSQGGRVVQPVHPIGPHGFRAIVVDSEGNRVALHSPVG